MLTCFYTKIYDLRKNSIHYSHLKTGALKTNFSTSLPLYSSKLLITLVCKYVELDCDIPYMHQQNILLRF